MKKRILFVDDESNILHGLQRLFRPMRHEWQTAFASGGQEALDILAKEPFDVLVSDVRMPGMDGLTLMNEVMREYPSMVRIALSGQVSEETTIRLADVAHQYLAKPCDPEKLKLTIDRAFALRDWLTDASLKQLISQLSSIPSMPSLYTELVEELNHAAASAQRAGEIIAQDPGMTAKILQLVNSAFFGLPRCVSDPAHAASMVGINTMKALVLGVEVFSQFTSIDYGTFKLESVWRHSVDTGALARRIAAMEHADREVTDASAVAGLLHDVGKLVLAQNLPQRYHEALACAREGGPSLSDAERQVLGATHAEVGAYLLALWGIPDPIVVPVAFHHCPSKSLDNEFSPLTAVHVANALVSERRPEEESTPPVQLDLDYLAQLGLSNRISTWRDAFHEVSER